jgi:hypothetical protein
LVPKKGMGIGSLLIVCGKKKKRSSVIIVSYSIVFFGLDLLYLV